MATKVTMPQMGYDMTEGAIQTWLKKEGDPVEKGDIIAEIETDKATVELEAFASGILKKIVVQPGQTVPVGETVAVIAEAAEKVDWQALGLEGDATPALVAVAPAAAASPPEAKAAPIQASASSNQTTAPAKPASLPRVATNLINLGAPVPTTGGPGGAAVESEMGEAAPTQKIDIPNPKPQTGSISGPGEGEGAEARSVNDASIRVLPEAAMPISTPSSSNGNNNGGATAIRQEGERIKSSPLARKVARENGVDLSQVAGSGPDGRVIKNDVLNFSPATSAPQPIPVTAPTSTPAGTGTWAAGNYEERDISRMRQTIARRLTEAKQQIPHIYISNEIDMGEAMKLRQTINTSIEKDGGSKVSVNDMLVKAVAKTLKKFPVLNSSYMETKLRVNQRINVSIAVALEDGLLTPVIFDADQKSIGQIALEARNLIEKARAGKLRPEEFQGGTFSVSNLGMFDVTDFVAVINPPNAAILAIGAVKPTPVVVGHSDQESYSEVTVAQIMRVTISVDHRATDGAIAAQFLQELKRNLQNPMSLLI